MEAGIDVIAMLRNMNRKRRFGQNVKLHVNLGCRGEPFRTDGLCVYLTKMLNKRKTRELAMQLLFVWDSHGEPDTALAEQSLADTNATPEVRQAAMQMAHAAWEQRAMIEAWVERLAPQWPPRRQPGVDRNILRLAVWELTSGKTPPKVVIDEAIELAKIYSTEQSPAFINGVLDAVLKEIETLKKE